MTGSRSPIVVGRVAECGGLDRVITSIVGGQSATLLLRGEAGVGKTTLLDYCERQASGLQIARVTGVESEMELPFAGLHQLCAPLLDHLDALPAPQQSALRVALGLSYGDPADRFRIALAALGLLAEAANERPLLCIVDDAHWLDRASAQILGFVGRRLLAEPVALVVAARDDLDIPELSGMPALEVRGLAKAEARAVLANAMPGPLDERVRDRLIAETRGNPLALLELARAPSVASAFGELGLGPPGPVSHVIEHRFQRRLEALTDETRRLLLVASAEPMGDPVLLWRAAARVGITRRRLPSEADGLLAVGERVTFPHPVVRSIVYRCASNDDRRAVHRALADVLDPEQDSDRRAWHLAAATPGPDEEVASALEQSAGRAQARGGFAAAAVFLKRAVALTREPDRRANRALAAAEASLRAGALSDARTAIETATAGQLDTLQAARADLLSGQVAFASGRAAEAAHLLLEAARQLVSIDLALARETYLGACGAALLSGAAAGPDPSAVGREVRALPETPGEPRAVDLLLDGFALLFTEGRAAAAGTLLEATGAFACDRASTEESLRWGWLAPAASNTLWDDDGVRAVCRWQIRLARAAGALEQLPMHLIALAGATARGGNPATAAAYIAEAEAATQATGTRMVPYSAELILASLRGSEREVERLARAAEEEAASSGQGIASTVALWTSAVLYNGLGRYEDARDAARSATADASDQFAAMWSLPELVEAGARTGDLDLARDALNRLVETTRPAATDYGLGVEARSRALLADDGEVEALHREAIDRLSRTQVRSELARAHLLYGEWLRREGRREAAREQLRTAHELFTAMEMAAFGERARRELSATGETVRRRTGRSADVLTPQERQIATLAGSGLTNAEIGGRLFVSPRTVEWHLKNVYRKLEISSRRHLQDALEA